MDRSDGYKLYEVKTAAWDKAWKRHEPSQYVGRGGAGGIAGRYTRFQSWWAGEPLQISAGRQKPGRAPDGKIIAATCGVTESGGVYFGNGRHRYAVFRDAGERIVVALQDADAERAQENGLLKRKVSESASISGSTP